MPHLTPGFFGDVAYQVLQLPISQTSLFLQPDAKLPAAPHQLTRIIRCRLTQQPPACDFYFLDGNNLEDVSSEGVYLLSASMNPLTTVRGGSSVMALNLAYTRIVAFAISDFPELLSLSLKGCVFLRDCALSGAKLQYVDLRETRISFGVRAAFGERALLSDSEDAEILAMEPIFAYMKRYNQVEFENLHNLLSLAELDATICRQICCAQNDFNDFRLLAAVNKQQRYVNTYEQHTLQQIQDNIRELKQRRTSLLGDWKSLIGRLELKCFVRQMAVSAYYNAQNLLISQLAPGEYSVYSKLLKSLAARLVFEQVEVQGKEVMFDVAACRQYMKEHRSEVYVAIENENALRLLCDGFLSSCGVDSIYGNNLYPQEGMNTMVCDLYHAERLGLFLYVPTRIRIESGPLYIEDFVAEKTAIESKYASVSECAPYLAEKLLCDYGLEELISQRMTYSDLQCLDLHGCGLQFSDNLQRILQNLPGIEEVDLSFNQMATFSFKSATVRKLFLQSNYLEKTTLDCAALSFLDVRCNKLQFLGLFLGLSQKTKLALECILMQDNAFQQEQVRLAPALGRYLKNLRVVNNVALAGVRATTQPSISMYANLDFVDDWHDCRLLRLPEARSAGDLAGMFYLAPPAELLNLPGLDSFSCAFSPFFYVQLMGKFAFCLKAVDLSFTNLTQQSLDSLYLPVCEDLSVQGNNVEVPRDLAQHLLHLAADCIDNLLDPCCIAYLVSLDVHNAVLAPHLLLCLRAVYRLVVPFEEIPEILFLLPNLEQVNSTTVPTSQRKQMLSKLTGRLSRTLLQARPICGGTLDLSGLQLFSLRADEDILSDLEAVTKLVFDENQLTSLECIDKTFPNLEEASFCKNSLEEPFYCTVNCLRLAKLDLSNNPIKSLRNEYFSAPALQSLIFQGSMLKTLNPAAFAFLSSISSLDLSNNSFFTISKETLQKMPNLRSLNVRSSCRNNLEIALRVRSQLVQFDCYFCRIASIQTVLWFCEKAPHLKVIRCANNPFCVSYARQNRSYVFDVLEANLSLQEIDAYYVKQSDVDRIIRAREEYEAAKGEEVMQIIANTQAALKRTNSSASGSRRGQSEKADKQKLPDIGGMKVCGVLPRVGKQ